MSKLGFDIFSGSPLPSSPQPAEPVAEPVLAATEPAEPMPAPEPLAEPAPVAAAPAEPTPVAEPVVPEPVHGDQVSDFTAERERYEARIKELEQARIDYPDELTRKLAEMAKSGASLAERKAFLEIQSLEPDKMAAIDAIKAAVALKHPNFTPEEQEAYIEQELGIDQSRISEPSVSMKVKLEQGKAVEAIRQAQVQVASAQGAQLTAPDKAQIERVSGGWKDVLSKSESTRGFAARLEGNGVNPFEFQYKYTDAAQQQAREHVASLFAANGMTFTRENAEAAIEQFHMFARALDFNEIVKSAQHDAWARATQAAMARMQGMGTPPAPAMAPPIAAPQRPTAPKFFTD